MILLFLGSWRSTMVVMISIPLSILTSLIVLYFLGETRNPQRDADREAESRGRYGER
jgi:hypothetical protein